MKKTLLMLVVVAMAFVPFVVGCDEACQTNSCSVKTSGCSIKTNSTACPSSKDETITELKKQIKKLETTIEMSKKQQEQSTDLMMQAFKKSQDENQMLKAEIQKLKAQQ